MTRKFTSKEISNILDDFKQLLYGSCYENRNSEEKEKPNIFYRVINYLREIKKEYNFLMNEYHKGMENILKD